MSIVGMVDSLWRYPVKSMRGEELEEAFVGFSGGLRRPLLRLQEFGQAQRIPLPDGARAATAAALSSTVS